jgi:hypothetical protein
VPFVLNSQPAGVFNGNGTSIQQMQAEAHRRVSTKANEGQLSREMVNFSANHADTTFVSSTVRSSKTSSS